MHSDNFLRSRRGGCNIADWEGGSVGGKDAVVANVLLHLLDDLVLDVEVLEDSLDDHVGSFESLVIDGSGGIGGDRVGLKLRQLLSFNYN